MQSCITRHHKSTPRMTMKWWHLPSNQCLAHLTQALVQLLASPAKQRSICSAIYLYPYSSLFFSIYLPKFLSYLIYPVYYSMWSYLSHLSHVSQPVHLSIYLSIYPSIYPFYPLYLFYLSICVSILSLYYSIYLLLNSPIIQSCKGLHKSSPAPQQDVVVCKMPNMGLTPVRKVQ